MNLKGDETVCDPVRQKGSGNAESDSDQSPLRKDAHDRMAHDHGLLSAYVGGDEQAFETLVERYFRMVFSVAARQTSDSHLAEEIAQSVFLILSRKARGLSSSASIPGWLLRTTRFVSRDAIKMRRRREEHERKLAMNVEPQPATNPDSSTMQVLLEEALEALRPEEQAGIMAHFFEGKEFHEIAQMFAITEHAARKRTSRCLAKLQAFMTRRGAKVSVTAVSGLLLAQSAHTQQALQSAISATHAACKGKFVADHVVALTDRAERVLRWQLLRGLSLKLALPLLIALFGLWAAWTLNRPVTGQIETLGRAWGALDNLVARHTQYLIQTPPTAPNYQATVQRDLDAISRQSSLVIGELTPLLVPPNERSYFAQFLTSELSETLHLDRATKTALLSYIRSRLAQGATLKEAMKALAQTTPTEAPDIKKMLSPQQRQVFNQVYGPDGALLFSYAKAVALGTIGP
jgi:RNA polymerase sigma factor (sigma-70 family)